jgi:hypothetical protein
VSSDSYYPLGVTRPAREKTSLRHYSEVLAAGTYTDTSPLNSVHNITIYFLNPLKTKCICFIKGLSAYRTVNTLHFGYKNQSLNIL